jgi:hypothetical protein
MHLCTDLCSSWTLKIFLGNFTPRDVLYFDWVGKGVKLLHLYFSVPHRFRLESSGMGLESAGMGPESTGMTRIRWNNTGIHLKGL